MSKLISQKQGIFSYISNSKSFNFLITAMPDFLEVQLKSKPKYHCETALHICPYNICAIKPMRVKLRPGYPLKSIFLNVTFVYNS